ncbi:VanZ family protein [Bacillus sp. 1P06AnD]|uniref:VanZ family protein n=1 Tax=Bacillus sp. 1P06AnD TaxID=3132208 RepID=UPI0039A0F19B
MLDGSSMIVGGVMVYTIILGIIIGITYKKHKKVDWLKQLFKFFFALYICMVISVTLFPLALWIDFDLERFKYSMNLIPFIAIVKDINQVGVAYDGDSLFMIKLIIRNVGGNIVMFIPLGILLPIVSEKIKTFKHVLLGGVTFSLIIECFQCVETLLGGFGRTVDIDDVLLNTVGTIIGFLIYKVASTIAKRIKGAISVNGISSP